ncbi:MAG: hypothetical protein K5637_03725 [Lachnospiraceae bacterium]|nr:hypothetical protein [Lachnospiraceae bacterium]
MKKIIIKRCVKIASLLIAVVLFLAFLQRYILTNVSDNTIRLRGFYQEEPNTLDVIVLGASEVYSDFSADELYKKTGVTSYPYSFAANPVTLWKYELREILERQTPKLLIVELNGAQYGKDMLYNSAAFRYLTQDMKLLPEKKEIIDTYGTDSKLSYYFPILKYHSEWHRGKNLRNGYSMLVQDMRGYSLLKGSYSHMARKEVPEELKDYDRTATRDLNPEAEKYFREFLDECKASGIENVLFVRFPHLVTDKKGVDALKRNNRAGEIAAEYGYEYLDMDAFCGEAGIERPEDFHNTDHLMMSGQMKFTDYLADYLVRKYDLKPTDLSPEQKEKWDESVRWMDACFAYYQDYMKDPVFNREYTVYERSDVMARVKKYLDPQ